MLFNSVYKPLMSDAFFNEFSSALKGAAPSGFDVGIEVTEFDDKFTLVLDLPGMAKSDVTIDLNDSVLAISGERQASQVMTEGEAEGQVVQSTRSYGHFQKSFKLPDTVNKEGIAAQMAAGVLTLTLPKQAKKETRISIDG